MQEQTDHQQPPAQHPPPQQPSTSNPPSLPLLPDIAIEAVAALSSWAMVGRLGSISKAWFNMAVDELRSRLANRTAGAGSGPRPLINVHVERGHALAATGWGQLRFLADLERRLRENEARVRELYS